MQSPSPLMLVVIAVAVLAVTVGGYFAYQTLSLSRARETLEEEQERLATELAVLKSTDQVLRAELLQEKLSTAERDLAAARQEENRLRDRNATLEENSQKIRPSFHAVNVLQQGFYGGNIAGSFSEIDQAIAALGDASLLEQWRNTERTVRKDLTDGSWSPQPIGNMLSLLLHRTEQLLAAP